MTDPLTILREGATSLGLTLTADQESRLLRFLDLLLERNQQVNLTAITDPAEVAEKHFLDSLTVEMVWQPHPGDWLIDLGAGAGFPGIPLAIRRRDVRVVLNDSVRKKVDFLRDAIRELELTHVEPVWARAEALGRDPDYRGRFNTVTARAVAHLGILIEYALPLLKVGGALIAMKGPSGEREAEDAAMALARMGGKLAEIRRLTLPTAGERRLIVVRKVRATPEEFPRDPGIARKKPLFLDSTRTPPLE